jgi:hypothetical protein
LQFARLSVHKVIDVIALIFIEANKYRVFLMKNAVKPLWHAFCKTVWQRASSRKN